MSDISYTTGFSFNDGAQSGGIKTASTLGYDFGTPALFEDSPQATTTAYADVTMPTVGWTNVTLAAFINRSDTPGEILTIARHSAVIAGLTKDANTDGGALPATLTAGHYTEISIAGTSQGKTWEIGDFAIYLGASGTYAQLRPAPICKLDIGETAQFRVAADGISWKVKSATGTPYLGKCAVASLA